METKTYAQTCSECSGTYQAYRRRKALSACGKAECLAAESARHNAGVEAARAERAATPRRPRQPRTPQPLWGDLATMATVAGVRIDGTGRSAR